MAKGRRSRGSGRRGGRGSSSSRGGGRAPSVGRGAYSPQQQTAAEAIADHASSLGFQCSINHGPDIQYPAQMKFMMACDEGSLRRLKALVGSLDEIDKELLASARLEGIGALHVAAMKGQLDICKYLVEELKFDVNSADVADQGPLTFAVASRKLAVVRYLLDNGADPNKQDHVGFAPLHEAAREGFRKIAQLLLSRGASVAVSSPEGTPLHAAAAYGRINIMQILLEHHADVNMVSAKLCTPLADTLLATPERLDEPTCLKCMKFLVEAGADLNSRKPETPLVISTIKGLKECVQYLLKAGADANIPANDVGSRPIEIAAESGNRKLVEMLFPFTSPIHAVSNWSIDGIIAYTESRNSKGKVNPSGKDSKETKKDDTASDPHPEDMPSNKDRKAQLKQQGGKAVEVKDYASALKFYSEAINLDPADAIMYSNRSFCHLKMGQAQDALVDANSCIRFLPEWTKGYYRKGAALMSLKEYKQACDAFMVGVKQDPTNEEMTQAFWEAAEEMKKEHWAAKCLDLFD